jgi:hypothetical protein
MHNIFLNHPRRSDWTAKNEFAMYNRNGFGSTVEELLNWGNCVTPDAAHSCQYAAAKAIASPPSNTLHSPRIRNFNYQGYF